MERISISLDDELLEEFDAFIRRKGYENRSEAIRDLLRMRLDRDRVEENRSPTTAACLSYVFDHHHRELMRRLTYAQHVHRDLISSILHVHLDNGKCLEIAILRGRTEMVRAFAETVMAATGVSHSNLHMVPGDIGEGAPPLSGRHGDADRTRDDPEA